MSFIPLAGHCVQILTDTGFDRFLVTASEPVIATQPQELQVELALSLQRLGEFG